VTILGHKADKNNDDFMMQEYREALAVVAGESPLDTMVV
jgi:hypothetical protein